MDALLDQVATLRARVESLESEARQRRPFDGVQVAGEAKPTTGAKRSRSGKAAM
jgi:hypothetical protein